MIEAYFIYLAILVGIYLILALSLQLAMGFTGLINLGHIAFFAVGAYTSALLTMNGISFIFAIFLSGFFAMFFGFLLSIPTNKLKGDYLALATLAFNFVVYSVTLNWVSLTRGPLGLPRIPKPLILGFNISSDFQFLILVFIMVLITSFILIKLVKSPFGKVLEATRDNELAARVLGKNTFKIKSIALAVSAFFAGIAGCLFAHFITYINPSSFTIMQLVPILCIVIIGGLASFRGTIIAAIILILLPEPLRFIGFPSTIIGPMRQIIYAVVLLLILLYKPKGFFGKVELE